MDKDQDRLAPLSALQLLDAAIWREIDSEEPQPQGALVKALSKVLAHCMLTYSQAPELEALTTICKTRRQRRLFLASRKPIHLLLMLFFPALVPVVLYE